MNKDFIFLGGIAMDRDESKAVGGHARADSLPPEERKKIAKKAAEARWSKDREKPDDNLPKATHGSPDSPLRIGEIEIPCYVLDDKRRVLVQRGMLTALNMSQGTAAAQGAGDRLSKFVSGKSISPFVSPTLLDVITKPILFRVPSGSEAYGYEATILADICEAVLEARLKKVLHHQQEHIAERCEILVRAFARVGIIALVDEATGFQYERPRRDLEEYLKKFLSEKLRRWVRTFPADYFKHLCRLRKVDLRPDMRLPQYFGHLTNDLIYRRLAPGLVRRLKERRSERGTQGNKLHSWLSIDTGVPEALVHLGTVVGLMKLNTDYETFEKQLDGIAPIYPETPGLFDDPKDWEMPED